MKFVDHLFHSITSPHSHILIHAVFSNSSYQHRETVTTNEKPKFLLLRVLGKYGGCGHWETCTLPLESNL